MDDYIDRRLEPELQGALDSFAAIALTGPRGVGKTTTATRLARSALRLDRPDDAGLVSADPDAALVGRAEPLLIDEWQVVPEVLGAVKRAVDDDPRPGRFILTGSVRGELSDAQWPGTGRVVPFRLYGLVPGETEGSTDATRPFLDRCFDTSLPMAAIAESTWSLPSYVRRAVETGFPATRSMASARRVDQWLAGYVDQLIERDVPEVGGRTNTVQLRHFLEGVAGHTGTDVAMQTLADAADVSWPTAASYWDLLERLHLVHVLPAWHSNRLKRLTRGGKRHLVEPGLVRALLTVDVDGVLRDTRLRGGVLESWVVLQLAAESQWCDTRVRLFHLRTRDRRHEIDVVVEGANGQLVAIEVKAAASPKPDDARHLRWLHAALSDRVVRTVLLHTGRHAFELIDGVEALPISSLWSG